MLSLSKQERIVLIFLLSLALIGLAALYFKKSHQEIHLQVIPQIK